MAILNKKNKAALFNPLSKDNPVIVQVLGICSCLAVTANSSLQSSWEFP